jgi:RNA polymerase sigma-70 factor, ECF subfamily
VDEEELVRLVARGDRAAFEELYRRTSPWLAVRLRRRCGDDELVAEVMQDTYLAVWRAAAAFAGAGVGGSAVGWLWTIAARRLVDALRRRARDARPPPTAALPVAVVPAAEDEVLQATVGDPVGEALRRLAPELREVLRAMVLDGLTVR